MTTSSINTIFLTKANIVQVVQGTLTSVQTTSVTGGTYAALTGPTVTITPTLATSRIVLLVHLSINAGANTQSYINILRGASNITSATTAGTTLNSCALDQLLDTSLLNAFPILGWDEPNTTSSTTYSLQVTGSGTVTVTLNAGATDTSAASTFRCASNIIAIEVAQ